MQKSLEPTDNKDSDPSKREGSKKDADDQVLHESKAEEPDFEEQEMADVKKAIR